MSARVFDSLEEIQTVCATDPRVMVSPRDIEFIITPRLHTELKEKFKDKYGAYPRLVNDETIYFTFGEVITNMPYTGIKLIGLKKQ